MIKYFLILCLSLSIFFNHAYGKNYENAENGNIDGWSFYQQFSGATITNVFDLDRASRVIEFSSTGGLFDSGCKLGDGATAWNDATNEILAWSMNFDSYFIIYISVETANGHRYITYTPDNTFSIAGSYINIGLGQSIIDGEWHTIYRNIAEDIKALEPGNSLTSIDAFLLRGTGRIDDIFTTTVKNSAVSLAISKNIKPTLYENAEHGKTANWQFYDPQPGATFSNVFNATKNSHVIEFAGGGIDAGYIIGGNHNYGSSPWNETENNTLCWKMKFSAYFRIFVSVQTTLGHRYIMYAPDNSFAAAGEYLYLGLGTEVIDGDWHAIYRNIAEDIKAVEPNNALTAINAFLVRGEGLIDDLYSTKTEFYETGEDKTIDGWQAYDPEPGATVTNLYDAAKQSRVINFTGGLDAGWILGGNSNYGSTPWNETDNILGWSFNFSSYFLIYISVETENGHRYIVYTPSNDHYAAGEYIYIGLGPVATGAWQTVYRDLAADLSSLDSGNKLTSINAFLIRGEGKIDDIFSTSSKFHKTVLATSGDFYGIKSAITRANPGDTVVIPEGTWVLTSGVDIDKEISICGMGREKTIMTGSATGFFKINAVGAHNQFNFFDMTLKGRGTEACRNGDYTIRDSGLTLMGKFDNFRIFNCRFEGFAAYGIVFNASYSDLPGQPSGVIFNCSFYDMFWKSGSSAMGYGVCVYGDNSYPATLNLGYADVVYVENNNFERCRHTIASNNGARYVYRYNTVFNNYEYAAVDAHGQTTDNPGSRSYEIYNNTVSGGIDFDTGETSFASNIGIRGGDGVIFNNTLSESPLPLWIYVETEGGIADKSYPVAGQIRDLWMWNNTSVLYPTNITNVLYSADFADFLQENRDYYFGEKPGYVPYIYPHPLQNGQ